MTIAAAAHGHALRAAQADAVARARARIDDDGITALLLEMVAMPSPTGEEAALAVFLAQRLGDAGLEAHVQQVGDRGANALGRLRGTGDGPSLLLYSAIDTPFAGGGDEDAPWLGGDPRADWALPPSAADGKVIGLGADNPKGYAAAVVTAVEAVARAGIAPRGDLWIALAGGSMPVGARPGSEAVVGLGSGIRALLDSIEPPDFAILVKPGYAVAHEEVGFAWFRITLRGALNYTGIRHKGPYRNPILDAAALVQELEAWFPEYTTANSAGLVAPQASINAIRAGSRERASFVPASAEIDLDMRLAPGETAEGARGQLEAALERIREGQPDLDLALETIAEVPGSATAEDSWIVGSLIAAWEGREGREHAPLKNASGASDAGFIRERGIEAARIGPPPPATPSPYPGFSMGVADVASIHGLADLLIAAIVDTVTRSRAEVGR
jgi:acetylornithine deacetylase/succinyl-diaminopimelate desuccinylase-like protein